MAQLIILKHLFIKIVVQVKIFKVVLAVDLQQLSVHTG
jgi:hypothetical protein